MNILRNSWDTSPLRILPLTHPWKHWIQVNINMCLGSPLETKNWRGTRLFGWKGCDSGAKDIIIEAFNDFNKIASQDGLYKNIDWNSQAAKDIWGHGAGNKAIPDDVKDQIKRTCSTFC